MPIALINLGSPEPPLTIMYSLTSESSKSDRGLSWRGEHKHYDVPGQSVSYTIRPVRGEKPASLWITGITFAATARIANQGNVGALAGWSAGFIQSIHHSERFAHYEGGLARMMRLDTSTRPLKDGQEDSIFYTDEKPAGESCVVELNDSPNFETPLRYGPGDKPLERTSGRDEFSTHLVLVRGKSILDLAQVEWVVNWDGSYDGAAKDQPWKPDGGRPFLTVSEKQNARLYADLDKTRAHTPFSLDLNEAECYCEILQSGSWTRCNMAGNTAKGQNLPHRSWVSSPV